jgi:tripartite-type tricarboxylate transporter receptor subunit TctC
MRKQAQRVVRCDRTAQMPRALEECDVLQRYLLIGAALVALASSPAAHAQSADSYPSRPVRIIVGSSPGGTADTVARLLAAQLGEKLAGTFVVENRPGASGAVASVAVARAAPDGYTLMLGAVNSHAILPNLVKEPQYDHIKDFAPVSLISFSPNLLLANPSFPAKSLAELVDLLKRNPGKYDYGSGGVGGSQQLATEILLQSISSRMTHVPFNGSGQLLSALIANTVGLAFDTMTTAVPLVQAGSLRALAISSLKRSPVMPDVPAVSELVPDFDVVAWNAIFAPAATPAPIIDKLSKTIAAIVRSPAMISRLSEQGTTAVGSTPAELAEVVARDTKKFGAAVAAAGIERR